MTSEVVTYRRDNQRPHVLIDIASDVTDVRALLEAGFSVGEAVSGRSRPDGATQLALLDIR